MKTRKWSEIEMKMSPESRVRSDVRYKQLVAEIPLEKPEQLGEFNRGDGRKAGDPRRVPGRRSAD